MQKSRFSVLQSAEIRSISKGKRCQDIPYFDMSWNVRGENVL